MGGHVVMVPCHPRKGVWCDRESRRVIRVISIYLRDALFYLTLMGCWLSHNSPCIQLSHHVGTITMVIHKRCHSWAFYSCSSCSQGLLSGLALSSES